MMSSSDQQPSASHSAPQTPSPANPLASQHQSPQHMQVHPRPASSQQHPSQQSQPHLPQASEPTRSCTPASLQPKLRPASSQQDPNQQSQPHPPQASQPTRSCTPASLQPKLRPPTASALSARDAVNETVRDAPSQLLSQQQLLATLSQAENHDAAVDFGFVIPPPPSFMTVFCAVCRKHDALHPSKDTSVKTSYLIVAATNPGDIQIRTIPHVTQDEAVLECLHLAVREFSCEDDEGLRLRISSHHRVIQQFIAHDAMNADTPPRLLSLRAALTKGNACLNWIHPIYNAAVIEYASAEAHNRAPSQLAFHDPDDNLLTIATVSPQDVYDAALIRRNGWRSLPSHLRDLWVTTLEKIAKAPLPHDLRVAVLVCAPVIFLDKHVAPKQELLHTHLMRLSSSTQYVLQAVVAFLSRLLHHHPSHLCKPALLSGK
jgi:hypothetical protein